MIEVWTSKPLALDSPDHRYPHGTANDNYTNAKFNQKLYDLIPARDVRLLDLGCAGGGFVKSILDDGGFAIGIEGSNYSKWWRRAEWPKIPNNLFTADITEPFDIWLDHEIITDFNVITAWEFFEHLPPSRLSFVLKSNVLGKLSPDGLVIGSIGDKSYEVNGTEYHQTIMPRDQWLELFAANGLDYVDDLAQHFGQDLVRNASNTPSSFPIFLRSRKEFSPDANHGS